MIKSEKARNHFVEIAIDGPHNRGEFIKADDIVSLRASLRREHHQDCYMTYFEYPEDPDGDQTNSGNSPVYSRILPVDIDSDDLEEAQNQAVELMEHLKKEFGIPNAALNLYFSGAKGFHIEISSECFGIEPSPYLPQIYKHLINKIVPKHIRVDKSIYDRRRLWRIENTINGKSGLYKIPLQPGELSVLSIQEIKDLAKQPRRIIRIPRIIEKKSRLSVLYEDSKNQFRNSKTIGKPNKVKLGPKLYADLPSGTIPVSRRNSTLISIAGKLRQLGLESNLVEVLVKSVNESKCDPPLKDREVDSILKSSDRYKDEDSNAYSLKIEKLSEVAQPDKMEWLWDGVIPLYYPTIIYGEGGKGKSLLALFIAIKASIGNQIFLDLSFYSKPLNALYLDWELNTSEVKRRAQQICRGLKLEKMPDNIYYAQPDKPLSKLLSELEFLVKDKNIEFVIIDSFTVSGVEPMDESQNIEVMNRLRKMGVTTLIIDHQAKSASGPSSKRSPFGTVYKTNMARSVLELSVRTEGYNMSSIILKHNKSNFGPKLKDGIGYSISFAESDQIAFEEKVVAKLGEHRGTDNEGFVIIKKAIEDLQLSNKEVIQKHILDYFKDKIPKNKLLDLLKQGVGKYWNVRRGAKGKIIYTLL